MKKSGSKISLKGPQKRGEVRHPKTMVDVMHRTVQLWEQGKNDEIAELLTQTGYKDNPAFKQFCQAVAESHLSGNKEKQLLEGFLIGIDRYAKYEKVKRKIKKDQTDLSQYGVK